jgi:hypothetical protein
MDGVKYQIGSLRSSTDLPHYALRIFDGVEKAIKEGREIEISANSLLFIDRMFSNRLQ